MAVTVKEKSKYKYMQICLPYQQENSHMTVLSKKAHQNSLKQKPVKAVDQNLNRVAMPIQCCKNSGDNILHQNYSGHQLQYNPRPYLI